jgi:hypothetical protein
MSLLNRIRRLEASLGPHPKPLSVVIFYDAHEPKALTEAQQIAQAKNYGVTVYMPKNGREDVGGVHELT